ncbi:MAG TPA: hypothetical protein GXZ48_04630 [Acholeplasmataceae bacterium]|nr:hypothetical protein [Acholeplasmataceae bacterium]
MKKLITFLLLFVLVGCTNAYAKLELSNQDKKTMLGIMKDPDFTNFHINGEIIITFNNETYDITLDSYNKLNEYSYNKLLVNSEKVSIFIENNNIYVDREINFNIDDNLPYYFWLCKDLIDELSLDSDTALDALTVHSFFLGHKFKYHFTDKHFNRLSDNSFIDLTLNYSGNILDSIDLNFDIGLDDAEVKGVLYIELKEKSIELPDLSTFKLLKHNVS